MLLAPWRLKIEGTDGLAEYGNDREMFRTRNSMRDVEANISR